MLTVRLFEMPNRGDVYLPQYDLIAAGGILVLLPIIPILILGQKRLVEGILQAQPGNLIQTKQQTIKQGQR